MRIVYHPAAREEARQTFLYYARIDERLAEDFEARVKDALRAIVENPEAYQVRQHDVRRCNLARFLLHYVAYIVRWRQIIVLAIGHSNRRPYYWSRRRGDAPHRSTSLPSETPHEH
jgi:plasmid stabilization system protein ParE